MEKRYLGDGVYADFKAGMIILTVEDGYEATETICIEEAVYSELTKFHDEAVK